MSKSAEAFRTISEVADDLGIPKHVLRFWEVKFAQIRPMKRGGGRRYYRPEDMELLKGIRHLLHREGYTIKGVQKILREQGVEIVKTHGQPVIVFPDAAADTSRVPIANAPANEMPRPKDAPRLAAATRRPIKQPGVPTAARVSPAELIAAAIEELEACRALLSGAPPATVGLRRRVGSSR